MKKLTALLIALCLLLCGCQWGTTPDSPPAAASVLEEKTLTVHFIDVGQADCALLECGGEYMLIDGGNREDGQLVVSYLEQLGVESLNTIISTHPHEDHLGGLPSVLAVYPAHTLLSPTVSYSSNLFDEFLYYAHQQGIPVEVPEPGSVYSLGDNETGATVTILGPVKSYDELNDTSIVCRVDYGETAFLFTGDMETTAENDMLDYWDIRIDWDVDVLKVGHHGSYSSTGYRFLNALSPAYAVIPCGVNNDYGYPHREPLARLKQAGCEIYRTDEMGTIIATTDGSRITFTWEYQSADPDDGENDQETTFIGNKNSKAFHSHDCTGLPAERNRVTFSTYDEAIAAGYTPCGGCLG